MLRAKCGFTLVELIIVMVLTGIILGVFGSVFYHFLIVPARQSDHLTAINELSRALDIIQEDGVQAESFTNSEQPSNPPFTSPPYYGYFYQEQIDSGVCQAHTIAYRYEDERLIREEWIRPCEPPIPTPTPTLSSSTAIASHIAAAEDVTFAYNEGHSKVLVTMTVTLNPGADNEVSETGIRNIDMRAAH